MQEENAETVEIRRNELIHKCINLQVLKDLLQKHERMIEERRSLITSQTDELDKLHQEVWSLQSNMCDEVWDFTAKHDIIGIFNNYPNIPSGLSLNCQCQEEEKKENVEMQQVRAEIEEIQSILNNKSHDLLKGDLSRAERELSDCKRESSEMQRIRREINEAKGRIALLKRKIEMNVNAIQDNTNGDYTEIENEIIDFDDFGDFSPDSSAMVNGPQSRNFTQLQSSQSVFPKNNNYYNRLAKFNDNSNQDSGFVKASTLIRNEESQSHFNNNPQCEKIIAEAVSNNDKSPEIVNQLKKNLSNNDKSPEIVNQIKKKFVPKTKSRITQGKRR